MEITEFINKLKKDKDIKEITHHETIKYTITETGTLKTPLPHKLNNALIEKNINVLYSHQVKAINKLRENKNIVSMTPTSSGKSLIYNLKVFEDILQNKDTKALFVFPLKSLSQDQLKTIKEFAKILNLKNTVKVYDGDTPTEERKHIRENLPNIIITTPDMLHYSINGYHEKWSKFFKDLKYIIIDELHTYKGVFGSNVSHVFKRTIRICEKYGSSPQFIALSATISNAKDLAEELTGLEFELINKSGAPKSTSHFLFVNSIPETSPYTMALRIFAKAIENDFKTIAFTKSRKITELLYTWLKQSSPDIAKKVSSYRSGYLPEERRKIEKKLFDGKLDGVISTSALELGIDIGGLDVCVLVGYPGTMCQTYQRAGRVGRRGRDSLVVMIALEDALDQYFINHPKEFFKKSMEASIIDKENPFIVEKHLMCAASEIKLREEEPYIKNLKDKSPLKKLERKKKIRYNKKNNEYLARTRYPHRDVSIREAGEKYTVLTTEGEVIAETSSARILKEMHPGAVYMQRGVHYVVNILDMGDKIVQVEEKDVNYYTRPITEKETKIELEKEQIIFKNIPLSFGTVTAREEIFGYFKKELYSERTITEVLLELPVTTYITQAIWFPVTEKTVQEIDDLGFSSLGALHALEHSMIATLPLFALCDRQDLGGVSYEFNDELESPGIFIYDGCEGGIGLSKRGFDMFVSWLKVTKKLMKDCKCKVACPSCTQDPQCGNNNEPLDKRGAIYIIDKWLKGEM